MENQKEGLLNQENEMIHGILMRILEKWRMEIGTSEEDLEKTVILSPENIGQREAPPPPKPIKGMEEAIPETVILSPKDNRPGIPMASPVASSKESVSIQRPDEPPEKDEFLEETVVLRPGKIRGKANE